MSESLRFQLNFIQKTGLYNTTLEVHGEEKPLDPEQKIIICRIAQEAFNNIIKHAGSISILVTLMYLPDKLLLSIEDDGTGFEISSLLDQGPCNKEIGNHTMYNRAKLIGAQFSIQNRPGKGTIAQLILSAS